MQLKTKFLFLFSLSFDRLRLYLTKEWKHLDYSRSRFLSNGIETVVIILDDIVMELFFF